MHFFDFFRYQDIARYNYFWRYDSLRCVARRGHTGKNILPPFYRIFVTSRANATGRLLMLFAKSYACFLISGVL